MTRSFVSEVLWLARCLLRQRSLASRRDPSNRILHAAAVSAGVFLFASIALGTYTGVKTLFANHAYKLLGGIPAWAFLIYLFTDIFIAFGQALGDMYLASDMPVLMVMPIRTASIIVAKFIGGVVQNEIYVCTFLVPFVLGFFLGTHAAWWAYPIALLAVLVFPAMLYAVLASITILALRYIPSKQAKEALWLIGAVLPTMFWVASFSGIAKAGGDLATIQLPPAPVWLPSTWVGTVVAELAMSNAGRAIAWLGFLLFVTLIACPAGLAFISSAFERGWSEALTVVQRNARRAIRRSAEPAWLALLRKDLVVLVRTPQLWFSHITSLGFVAYLLVGHRFQTPMMPLTLQLAMAQMGFVAVLTGLNPGMTALSLEHASAWILKASPLLPRDILKAKLGVSFGQTALVVIVGSGVLAYGYGFQAGGATALVIFALLMGLCSVCCGIGFDTTFPSFQWENPNSINRGIRMVIPFVSGVAVLALCAGFLGAMRVALHDSRAVVVGLLLSALAVGWVAERALRVAHRNIASLEL